MQQVSTLPSTDSARCPTDHPSSRWWPAWLTRTRLAPRPWPREKRPVWTSSSSCWQGPTQISVKHHDCLLWFYFKSIFSSPFPFFGSVALLACVLLTLSPPTALHFLTVLRVGMSSNHLDMQMTRQDHKTQHNSQTTKANDRPLIKPNDRPFVAPPSTLREFSLSSPKSSYVSLFPPLFAKGVPTQLI